MASELVITGIGMVTALGHDVASSCAAIRCNMDRPAPIDGHLVWDPRTEQDIPLTGFPVRGVTEGLEGLQRWVPLAQRALEDLFAYAAIDPTDKSVFENCGLIFCGPELGNGRFGFDHHYLDSLPLQLIDEFRLGIDQANIQSLAEGHRGPLKAVHEVAAKIRKRSWQRALIIAADSWLDEASLDWLTKVDRLKTPEYPVGFMPGEAAACLLVEAQAHTKREVDAAIESVAIAEESDPHPDTIRQGGALSKAIVQALEQANGHGKIGDIFADINGEELPSITWGVVRPRIPTGMLREQFAQKTIASSLGEVGAASAAVSLCAATRAFVRGYSTDDASLIWALSDQGQAGACVIRRVEN